ncbi:hypothetical protein [Sphingopyxis panaciterrae]
MRPMLLLTALFAAEVAAAQTAPVPPPLPEPKTRWVAAPTGKVKTLNYRLDPATAPLPPLSIAQRHAIANRLGKSRTKPLDIVVACWVAPSGAVTDDCTPYMLDPAVRSFDFTRLPRPSFPVFPAATDRGLNLRRVEYGFRYDGAPLAPIDWTRGPLVDRALIGPIAASRWAEYPFDAMRAQKEAKASVECQVLDDLSIACRTLSVAPAEQAKLFANAGEYQMIPGTAPATLADGRSSIGARARFDLDFRLPD